MTNDAEDEVRATNEAFYRAFRNRDADAMASIWAEHAPVSCVHPGMDPIEGRDEVLSTWRRILGHRESPQLLCADVKVHLLSETAYVVCLEGMAHRPPALIATNIFVREDGLWRMVHHHAAPLSPKNREALGEAPKTPIIN